MKEHIQAMQQKRDELVTQARPPQVVLDAALADPEAVKLGARFNKAYAAALRKGEGQHTNVLERAKVAAEDYLTHFPPERRGGDFVGGVGQCVWEGGWRGGYGRVAGGE